MHSLFANNQGKENSGITLVDLSGRISRGDGSAFCGRDGCAHLEEGPRENYMISVDRQ